MAEFNKKLEIIAVVIIKKASELAGTFLIYFSLFFTNHLAHRRQTLKDINR